MGFNWQCGEGCQHPCALSVAMCFRWEASKGECPDLCRKLISTSSSSQKYCQRRDPSLCSFFCPLFPLGSPHVSPPAMGDGRHLFSLSTYMKRTSHPLSAKLSTSFSWQPSTSMSLRRWKPRHGEVEDLLPKEVEQSMGWTTLALVRVWTAFLCLLVTYWLSCQ